MLNDYAPVIAPVIAIINSVIAGQFLRQRLKIALQGVGHAGSTFAQQR
jgi:hypothetical protein